MNPHHSGYNYRDYDRWLKEPFINSIDYEEITQEFIKDLMAQRNKRETDSEQLLMGAQ